MKMILKLATLLTLSPLSAFGVPTIPAGGLSQGFNFDGVLTDASGQAITGSTQIKLRILDPGANCMLFEEDHTVLPAADGSFSVRVGGGTRTGNDSNYTFARIFQNSTAFGNNPGVCLGYTPVAGDGRRLRVIVGGSVQLTPDFDLASVPAASVAETLQGRAATDFIQVRVDGSNSLSQANAENVFSTVNYAKLVDLLAGNGYMPSAPTAAVSFNNQLIQNVAAPISATDATNKTYTDTKLAGKALDLTDVGMGSGNGKVLTWDGAQNKWVAIAPTATDSTKLPLAGGTMSGTIDMGNNQLINSGNLNLSPGYTLKFGGVTTTGETTLTSALALVDAGRAWYNSDSNKIRLWTGAAAVDVGAGGGGITALTGDISATGTGSVASTIANGVISTAKLFGNPGVNRLVMTDATTGAQLAPKDCAMNEILKWTASGWACAAQSGDFQANGTLAMTGQLKVLPGAYNVPGLTFAGDTDTGIYQSGVGALAFTHDTNISFVFSAGGMQSFTSGGAMVLTAPGSSSAPTYSFAGDADTGMFQSGANNLSFATGSNEQMRILSNGNVGINNLTPSEKLTVTGTIYSTTGGFRFPDSSVQTTAYTGGALNSTLNSGNIFVGNGSNTAVGVAMSGDATLSNTGVLSLGNTGTAGTYYRVTTDAKGRVISGVGTLATGDLPSSVLLSSGNSGAVSVGTNTSNVLNLKTSNLTRMVIDASGNVGIGSSSPTQALEIVKGADSAQLISNLNTSSGVSAKAGFQAVNDLNEVLSFSNLSSGYSGTGANLPSSAVLAYNGAGGLSISGSNASTGMIRFFTNSPSNAANERVRITYNGDVGIGTSTPSSRLEIIGGSVRAENYLRIMATPVSSTATYTIPNTNPSVHTITLSANATVTLPTFTTSNTLYELTVIIKQDATGNRTLAWAQPGGDTLVWNGGTVIAPTTTANAVTIYRFIKSGGDTVWYANTIYK